MMPQGMMGYGGGMTGGYYGMNQPMMPAYGGMMVRLCVQCISFWFCRVHLCVPSRVYNIAYMYACMSVCVVCMFVQCYVYMSVLSYARCSQGCQLEAWAPIGINPT